MKLPASLRTIFAELVMDLDVPYPKHGNLESWCRQGVLLWNATPTCYVGRPGSHSDWTQWPPLTQEIIERLSAKGHVVFVFMGSRAREYVQFVDQSFNDVICTSHPSPRGQMNTRNKLIGSRLFSTINDKLNNRLKEPINWEVPD